MMRVVHGCEVHGVRVDAETRCAHWRSPPDIIAIRFKCCGRWFPCHECHLEIADHLSDIWSSHRFGEKAVLCGACGHQLAIDEYLASGSKCTSCSSPFNPGCANHYDLYFAVG